MKKRKLLIAAALLSVFVLLTIGVTMSYLTDFEVMNNVITIGKVDLELDEGGFKPSVVVPGSKVTKAPKLKNIGTKDEFVFIKLIVPKEEVTLLYEDTVPDPGGHEKGTPKEAKKIQELFRFLVTESDPPDPSLPTARITNDLFTDADKKFDQDIAYHVGSDGAGSGDLTNTPGWIFLESDLTGDKENIYFFGYNKKLTPEGETVTLFDAVQLKSFIDGEVTGVSDIGVFCYGIQTENLQSQAGITWGEDELTAEYLSKTTLDKILDVVEEKLTSTA